MCPASHLLVDLFLLHSLLGVGITRDSSFPLYQESCFPPNSSLVHGTLAGTCPELMHAPGNDRELTTLHLCEMNRRLISFVDNTIMQNWADDQLDNAHLFGFFFLLFTTLSIPSFLFFVTTSSINHHLKEIASDSHFIENPN